MRDGEDDERFLAAKEVRARYSVSGPTLYRWIHAGHFPKPVKLGLQASRWRLSDLVEFERRRSEVRVVGDAVRRCAICGRPWGTRRAAALRRAGFAVPPGTPAYAHPACLGESSPYA